MFDPASLRWTSRDEVTAALLSARDADPFVAITALDLCGDVAPPSAAPALLAVARARDRPYWVRVYALRAYVGTATPLPDEALESFFAGWFYSPRRPFSCGPAEPGELELGDLLAAVTTPAHERIAMRWLASSSPDVRAEALVWCAISAGSPAPRTAAWLADDWLASGVRGGGTSALSRAMNSVGVITRCVAPALRGDFTR